MQQFQCQKKKYDLTIQTKRLNNKNVSGDGSDGPNL